MEFALKKWLILGIFILCFLSMIHFNIFAPTKMINTFASSDSIKIISYNIHYGMNIKRQPILDNILSFLKSSDSDIIFLQEVDHKTFRSYFQNQPEYIIKKLSMDYMYTPTQNMVTGQTGNMMISRYPIVSSEEYTLSFDKYPRKMQKSVVQTPFGDLAIFNTHLDLSRSVRKKQIDEIVKILEETKEPFVLAGDMNAPDPSELYKLSSLAIDTGKAMEKENIPTFINKKYKSRIDYIFISNGISLQSYEVPSLTLSDHEPVIIEIQCQSYRSEK